MWLFHTLKNPFWDRNLFVSTYRYTDHESVSPGKKASVCFLRSRCVLRNIAHNDTTFGRSIFAKLYFEWDPALAYRDLQERITPPCRQAVTPLLSRLIRLRTAFAMALLGVTFLLGGCSTTNDLQSIAITPPAGTQILSGVGQTAQFKAIGTFIQGQRPATTQDITTTVTWTSHNTVVATVSPAGVVSAVGTGNAIITAALSDAKNVITGSSDVTVNLPAPPPPPVLTSIAITPAAGTQILTAAGQSAQYKAIGTFTRTGLPTITQDITGIVAWLSQNTSVATVSSTGVVSALANGTATVSATYNGDTSVVTGTSDVTVNIPPMAVLTSIAVLPAAGTQILTAAGQTAQYRAVGTFTQTGLPTTTQDITHNVDWSSQDIAVATVSSIGVATAQANGNATISATYTGATSVITGSSDVTVNIPPPAALMSIAILPSGQSTTTVGETAQYIAIGTYNGTPSTQDLTNHVTWSSSDVTVARVSATGLATALAPGSTTITALKTDPIAGVISATATFTAASGGITLPIVTVYKVGNSASAGAVTASYVLPGSPSQSPITPINCSPSASASQCTAAFPAGVTVTLTVTASDSAFGGWSSNCSPVYSTQPTPPSAGVLATPDACTFTTTTTGNYPVGAIFN
jgi:hypothetical protein